MSLLRDVHVFYSGPQLLDDLTKTIAQVAPSLRLALLPVYVLQLVLRWVLAAPNSVREVLRQYLARLRSRVRSRSRIPRLHFAEADASAEKARLAVRGEKGTLRLTMREFVCSRCPSLLREFKPSKVLFK